MSSWDVTIYVYIQTCFCAVFSRCGLKIVPLWNCSHWHLRKIFCPELLGHVFWKQTLLLKFSIYVFNRSVRIKNFKWFKFGHCPTQGHVLRHDWTAYTGLLHSDLCLEVAFWPLTILTLWFHHQQSSVFCFKPTQILFEESAQVSRTGL